MKNGITQTTASEMSYGMGVYFAGVPYNEKVAPTEEEIMAAVIGVTRDGGRLTITPEFYTPQIDGALVRIKEFQYKVGETAVLETTMLQIKPTQLARSVIGEINNSTDTNYDVITSSELRAGHFYEGFGYYGNLLDGRPFICIFKNALCTNGFALESRNKEDSRFAATFECHSDLTYGTHRLPYALFIRRASTWDAATLEEITGKGYVPEEAAIAEGDKMIEKQTEVQDQGQGASDQENSLEEVVSPSTKALEQQATEAPEDSVIDGSEEEVNDGKAENQRKEIDKEQTEIRNSDVHDDVTQKETTETEVDEL